MIEKNLIYENSELQIEPVIILEDDNKNFESYKGKHIKGLDILYADQGSKDILACMTVYNEPAAAILVSLYALVRNTIHISQMEKRHLARRISVCIIVDGIEKLSKSAKELFIQLGLFKLNDNYENADFYITESNIGINELEVLKARLNANNYEDKFWLNIINEALEPNITSSNSINDIKQFSNVRLNVKLCLKRINQGKLDSHWWFFNIICDKIKPKYCIQMDAGTAPKEEAIFNLYKHFEKDTKAGAAATMILFNKLENPLNLLHLWQSGDFIYQRLFSWPTEILTGYLTAIPGQFCFIRYEAFKGENLHDDSPNSSAKIQKVNSPSDNYFRGLKPLDPFQSTMFLAEDRILGFEVLSDLKNNWNLVYLPSAVAITDSCKTLPELLHQRRRWYNSEFTCNIWLILKIKGLAQNKKVIKDKLSILLTISSFLLNGLFVFLLPVFTFIYTLIFKITCVDKIDHLMPTFHFLNSLIFTFFSLYAIQIFIFASFKSIFLKKYIFYLNSFVQLTLFTFSIFFMIKNNFVAGGSMLLPIIFFAEIIAGLLLSMIYSKSFLKNYIKICIPFFLLRPIIFLQFRTYSFCNIHDNSWGTKGLDKMDPGNYKSSRYFKSKEQFRYIFLLSWMGFNSLVLFWFCLLDSKSKINIFDFIVYFIAAFTLLKILGGAKTYIKNSFLSKMSKKNSK